MWRYHPDFSEEKNRLGVTFGISVLLHITLALMFAAFAGLGDDPAIRPVKRFIVEFFEQDDESSGDRPPEEMERLADKSRKVERETAPRKQPSPVVKEPAGAAVAKVEPQPAPAPAIQIEKPVPAEKALPEEVVEIAEDAEKQVEPVTTFLQRESEQNATPTREELVPDFREIASPGAPVDISSRVEEGEEVSLNTTEFRYAAYFDQLRRKIRSEWGYPEAARLAGLQGRLKLRFVIDSEGRLRSVRVVKSSGFPILDEEALRAVRRAAPFYAIPASVGKTLTIGANFEYSLDYVRVQ